MRQSEASGRVIKMNDQELLYLKFQRRFSTQQLLTRFPRQRKRIVEVALLDVNVRRLHELINQKRVWDRLKALRKKFREMQQNKGAIRETVLLPRERHYHN